MISGGTFESKHDGGNRSMGFPTQATWSHKRKASPFVSLFHFPQKTHELEIWYLLPKKLFPFHDQRIWFEDVSIEGSARRTEQESTAVHNLTTVLWFTVLHDAGHFISHKGDSSFGHMLPMLSTPFPLWLVLWAYFVVKEQWKYLITQRIATKTKIS